MRLAVRAVRPVPDDIESHKMGMPVVAGNPYVRRPAGGPEDAHGGPEILNGCSGRAPQPYALAERLADGSDDGGEPSVSGLGSRLDEPDPQPLWRDDPPSRPAEHLVAL